MPPKKRAKETKPRKRLTVAEKKAAIEEKKAADRKRKAKARKTPQQKEIRNSNPKGAKTCTYKDIETWTKRIGAVPPAVRCYVEDPHFGRLGYFDFLPSIAELKKEFGEGRFKLKVHRPNDRGTLVYAACRTVTIG
jgi:hypothetical protein